MRKLFLHSTLLLFLGCVQHIEKNDLELLNGYWEIDTVEFPNGQKKEYTISTTIDYMELDGMMGFRKKVRPQLNGFFTTSDDAEPFGIFEKNGAYMLSYGQGTDCREEVLLSLDKNSFSFRNKDNTIYHYKRYQPLNLVP